MLFPRTSQHQTQGSSCLPLVRDFIPMPTELLVHRCHKPTLPGLSNNLTKLKEREVLSEKSSYEKETFVKEPEYKLTETVTPPALQIDRERDFTVRGTGMDRM